VVAFLSIAPMLGAQQATPTPPPRTANDPIVYTARPTGAASNAASRSTGTVVMEHPPEVALDKSAHPLSVRGGAKRGGDSIDATPLKGAQVLSIDSGRAHLRLADGTARDLAPGDVVGSDTVKSVQPHRIVLQRAKGADRGEALVILAVEADGHTRLSVYQKQDPNARPIPMMAQ
jgi:hypothetical protein